MFFRREKPKVYTFQDRIAMLEKSGFKAEQETGGGTRVSRQGCAAVLKEAPDGKPLIAHAGVLIGKEIGLLVDVGYQKVWRTASGKQEAAQANHLKALHAFTEDLRDGLDLTSLYNEGLGTTNDVHLYDRVEDRDFVHHKAAWER
jgi:hypothetical protein